MQISRQFNNPLTKTSAFILRIVLVANRVLLAAFLAGLLTAFLWPVPLAKALLGATLTADLPQAIVAIRLELLVGITMSVCADRIFAALAQIVASTSLGDPFILANAQRLRTIGWSLLVLQLIGLPEEFFGKFFSTLGHAAPHDYFSDIFSVGGWISVLMVFILSRIFAAGAAMRADLEGTV